MAIMFSPGCVIAVMVLTSLQRSTAASVASVVSTYKIPAEAPDKGCYTYDLSSIAALGHMSVPDNSTTGRASGWSYVFALDSNVPSSALPAYVAPALSVNGSVSVNIARYHVHSLSLHIYFASMATIIMNATLAVDCAHSNSGVLKSA